RAALAPALPVVIMGRSLGSACAAELADALSEPPAGVIFESGFSDLGGFFRRRGLSPALVTEIAVDVIGPLKKLAGSKAPLLVLPGELANPIPTAEGRGAYEAAGASEKRIVVVPGRGHNDLSMAPAYWEAIGDFVRRIGGSRS